MRKASSKKGTEVEIVEKKQNPVITKLRNRAEKYAGVVSEVIKQYREITVGSVPQDRTIRIFLPTPKIESESSKSVSKTWGKLIKDEDLQTETEILKILEKRGIWTKDDEAKYRGVQQRLSKVTSSLFKLMDKEDADEETVNKLTEEYQRLDKEFSELLSLRSSHLSNSIENRLSEVRVKEQMWRCVKEVKKEEGENEVLLPVWNSFDELDNEKDRVLLISVMNECITFWQGVPADFLEDSPETQVGEEDIP